MSDKPMTRRQRREAERAAAQAALRQEAEAEALAAAARRRSEIRSRQADLVAAGSGRVGDSTLDAIAEDTTADATTASRSTAAIARAGAAAAVKELEQEAAAVQPASPKGGAADGGAARLAVSPSAPGPAGAGRPGRSYRAAAPGLVSGPVGAGTSAIDNTTADGPAAGEPGAGGTGGGQGPRRSDRGRRPGPKVSRSAQVSHAPTPQTGAALSSSTASQPGSGRAQAAGASGRAQAAGQGQAAASAVGAQAQSQPAGSAYGRPQAVARRLVRKPNAVSAESASRFVAHVPAVAEDRDGATTVIHSHELTAGAAARDAAAQVGPRPAWATSDKDATEELDLAADQGGSLRPDGEEADALPRSYRPRLGTNVSRGRTGAAGGGKPRPTGIGTLGRASVLAVLGVLTIVIPLTGKVPDITSFAAPRTAPPVSAQASQQATGSSLAAPILGSDADVDDSSNAALSNVPDAATLARIKEAYANASQSCAVKTGASGEAAAFVQPPGLYMPMIAGSYVVSSPFGYRLHPTLGYMRLHAGQDWAASVGTPIYAVADGKVTTAHMVAGMGTITIQHHIGGQVWYSRYLHMYQDGIYVTEGQEVKAGDLIAGVGSSGQSTGAHLHFEIRTADDWEDGSAQEPGQWLKDHGAVELSSDCK